MTSLTRTQLDAHLRDVDGRRPFEAGIDADHQPEPSARVCADRDACGTAVELLELITRHATVRIRVREVANRRRLSAIGELVAVVEARAIVLLRVDDPRRQLRRSSDLEHHRLAGRTANPRTIPW